MGDLFTVPTGDGRAAVGQIVARYAKVHYYLLLFDAILPEEEVDNRAVEATREEVLFQILTLDAKFYVGDWTVIGSAPVDLAKSLPVYKVARGLSPGPIGPDTRPLMYVEDFSGKRSRPISEDEADALPYRTVTAPVGLEKALRAHLGLEPLTPRFFDKLLPGGPTSAEYFPDD